MSSLRLLVCFFLLSSAVSAWSFDEWAATELLPRTRDLVRRHMVGARMFLTEPKKGVEGAEQKENINEKKANSLENSNSSSSSSSSSEEKKVIVKKEEIVAVTTQQPTISSSSSPTTSSSPSTTTSSVSSVEKKTSEEEMAGKIVDVAEVLRKIAEKKEGKKGKSIAEVKLEKKLEKLVKETKVEGGVSVERVRKISSSPAPSATGSTVPATTPIAEYRRVSCDMCLKAFNGLNYNVVQMKKVAEDMVSKDCEALLYGDEEAIGACVEVMLRKIEEYYNKFEPMIQTNKACVRLGMCAPHLVTNRIPQ